MELQFDKANIVNLAIAVHPDGRQVAFLAGTQVAGPVGGPPREFRILERLLPSAGGGASSGGY